MPAAFTEDVEDERTLFAGTGILLAFYWHYPWVLSCSMSFVYPIPILHDVIRQLYPSAQAPFLVNARLGFWKDLIGGIDWVEDLHKEHK